MLFTSDQPTVSGWLTVLTCHVVITPELRYSASELCAVLRVLLATVDDILVHERFTRFGAGCAEGIFVVAKPENAATVADSTTDEVFLLAKKLQSACQQVFAGDDANVKLTCMLHTSPVCVGVLAEQFMTYDIVGGAVSVPRQYIQQLPTGSIVLTESAYHRLTPPLQRDFSSSPVYRISQPATLALFTHAHAPSTPLTTSVLTVLQDNPAELSVGAVPEPCGLPHTNPAAMNSSGAMSVLHSRPAPLPQNLSVLLNQPTLPAPEAERPAQESLPGQPNTVVQPLKHQPPTACTSVMASAAGCTMPCLTQQMNLGWSPEQTGLQDVGRTPDQDVDSILLQPHPSLQEWVCDCTGIAPSPASSAVRDAGGHQWWRRAVDQRVRSSSAPLLRGANAALDEQVLNRARAKEPTALTANCRKVDAVVLLLRMLLFHVAYSPLMESQQHRDLWLRLYLCINIPLCLIVVSSQRRYLRHRGAIMLLHVIAYMSCGLCCILSLCDGWTEGKQLWDCFSNTLQCFHQGVSAVYDGWADLLVRLAIHLDILLSALLMISLPQQIGATP